MDLTTKFTKIGTLIFDVDGVFTDGTVLMMESGEIVRKMSARDAFAIRLAVEMGYRVCIITGGTQSGILDRLKTLGIDEIYTGIDKKLPVFLDYLATKNIPSDTVLYCGDDLPDLPVLKEVFLSVCPRDAVPEVLAVCDYISPKKGGKGCIRDLIEKVLKSRQNWPY
jgi:3-deoxy-D-manno-octulosonate 8-phosphate phosphatase (KDO 8-P phosphatase)